MEQKPRIAFLISTMNTGGAELQLLYTINNIDKEKYDVALFVVSDKMELIDQVDSSSVFIKSGVINSITDAFKIIRFLNSIDNFSPDILHSHMYTSNLLSRMYKAFFDRGVKVINHVHGLGFFLTRPKLYLDRGTKFLTNKFLMVSEASKSIRETREKYNSNKCEVVYNAVSFDKFSPQDSGTHRDRIILGIAARLIPLKKIERTILLVKYLRDKFDLNVYLSIAGGGPEAENLNQLVIDNELLEFVEFKGLISSMPLFYNSIDVFVLSSEIEDLPVSIIEALATNLLVVASDVGGVKELLEGTESVLVTDWNSDDEMKTIANFIKNKLENQLENHNRKISEKKFSIEAQIRQIENIYASLLNDDK